jgi:hypothetical protein
VRTVAAICQTHFGNEDAGGMQHSKGSHLPRYSSSLHSKIMDLRNMKAN